jgi:hypothetical protein
MLLTTVLPLVLRKAYGRADGLAAVMLSLATLVGVATLARLAAVNAFPLTPDHNDHRQSGDQKRPLGVEPGGRFAFPT